jgi:hypothetical protein
MILNLEITSVGETEVVLSKDYNIRAIRILRFHGKHKDSAESLWMRISSLSLGHVESSHVQYESNDVTKDNSTPNVRTRGHDILLCASVNGSGVVTLPCSGFLPKRFKIAFYRARGEPDDYPTISKPLLLVLDCIEEPIETSNTMTNVWNNQ